MSNSQKYQEAQARIVELCGQDQEWLQQLTYHKGVAYLEHRYKKVRTTINLLSRSRAFWAWWQNQMNIRIVEFLETIDMQPEMYHTDKGGYLTPALQKYILMQFLHFISTYRSVYPNEVVWKAAEKEMYQAVDAELKDRSNAKA